MAAERFELTGGRLRFMHGPMDLVIGAEGDAAAVAAAHAAAWQRFQPLLAELVAELPLLRRAVGRPQASVALRQAQPERIDLDCPLRGVVARRMWAACAALPTEFITPMAAVAGAVAEEVLGAYRRTGITRAWVNNGGDIALHLAPGAAVQIGVVADIARGETALDGTLRINHADPVRGIATSGWRGRSQSLGIADSVTVLAHSAAAADAAATLIANAVNVDDPRIGRRPAHDVKDDSDLGERLVTVHVPLLPATHVQEALQRGQAMASEYRVRGLIHSAALWLQGQCRLVQGPASSFQRRSSHVQGQAPMLSTPAHPLQSQLAA